MRRYRLTVTAVPILLLGGGIGWAMARSGWERNVTIDQLQMKCIELVKLRESKTAALNRQLERGLITQEHYSVEYDRLVAGSEQTVRDFEESKEIRRSARNELISGAAVMVLSIVASIFVGGKAVRASSN